MSLRTRWCLLWAQDHLWLATLAVFFVLTARWMSWQGGIAATGGQDVQQYVRMAEAAPGAPDTVLGSAYTDRFVLHWLVGAAADLTGVSVELTYRMVCGATMVAFALTAQRCLVALEISGWARRVCLALAVLNPHALRYYGLVPGYVGDVVFQFGLALALLGTISRRSLVLLAGLLVATLARQTIVLVAPLLALWLLLSQRRGPTSPAGYGTAFAVAVLPVVVLGALRALTRPFSTDYSPHFPEDTIIPLLGQLPATAAVLAEHLARVAVPLLLGLSVLLALVVLRLRRGRGLPLDVAMSGLVCAAVVGQPLVIGPAYSGFAGNEPRLSALGLLPLVLCLGAALRSLPAMSRGRAGTLLLLVGLASLHHIYTVVGPTDAFQFLAVQGASAVIAFLVVVTSAGHQRGLGPVHRLPRGAHPT